MDPTELACEPSRSEIAEEEAIHDHWLFIEEQDECPYLSEGERCPFGCEDDDDYAK